MPNILKLLVNDGFLRPFLYIERMRGRLFTKKVPFLISYFGCRISYVVCFEAWSGVFSVFRGVGEEMSF